MNLYKKIVILLATFAVVVGCSTSAKHPTLVNQASDEKAFEILTETKLIAEIYGATGDDKTAKIIAYIPESSSTSNYGDAAYSEINGVFTEIELNDYGFDEGAFADDVANELVVDAQEEYDLLETISTSEVTVNKERDEAFFEVVQLRENYDYDAEGFYKFVLVKEISKSQRVTLMIEIEASEYNKYTDQTIAELEKYYGIKLNFDKEVVDAAVTKYNENPPETKTFDAYPLQFDLPRSYDKDYAQSDYSNDAYGFGLDGDALDSKNNAHVYILGENVGPFSAVELQAQVESIFTGDEEYTTKFSQSEKVFEGKTTIHAVMSYLDVTRTGYIVHFEGYIVYVFTDSYESSVPAEQMKVVDQIVETMREY